MENNTVKHMVKWNKGKAHLAEQGSRHTFCGETFYFRNGWACDQDATLQEFVDDVHPHCRACAKNAEIAIAIELIAEELK